MTDIRAFRLQVAGNPSPLESASRVLRVRFRLSANGVSHRRAGTAFRIRPWSRVLVTCAHLLEIRDGDDPVALELEGTLADGSMSSRTP